MGSILTVVPALIVTGVTTKFDDGSLQIGATFWAVSVLFGVAWIAAVLLAAHTEQKYLRYYFYAGMSAPAWGIVLIQSIQRALE